MTFFTRPTSPALDEILGQKFPVLDHGFVRVVDYMGNDGAIVQAARVSYGGGTKTPQEDANLIRYLMRHRHCYAAYMQVLTVQGWKRWDECGPTETFLVPDPATRTYQRETCALETFDVDEKLVTYSNSRMSFAVTPDHRMWFKGKYQSRFSIHHASTMPRWGHFDPLVGYHCPETKNATSSPWFKLLGFYLGDGCHESPSRISFHLRKERKKKFLRSIIEALELETIERMSSTYDDADVIYIKVPPGFFDYVIPNVRSAEKALMPEVIDTLDGPAIRGLWEGLVNSDGHIAEDRYQITYSSTSPELIKLFSALGAMLGYDVHNVFGDDRATAYSINTRTTLEARKGYFDEQTYKGKVYCATTSTGLLAVRGGEDKFGFVCGNTSPFEMCVDGDTRVQTFPCPGAAVKHYTMRELAAAFEAGSAGSWARLTYISTVNPNTGMVERTRIKRVWKTGVKPCFRVTVGALSRQIIVTDNHPFLCPDGEYRTLADLSVGSEVALNGRPATPTDIREHVISMRSAGKKLDEISRALGIAPSTVCKLARQAGLRVRAERKTGFLKKDIGDHADPRSIARRRVPHGPCMLCGATGRDIHHIDENPHNNDASNLLRLCAKHHRHIHTYGVLKKAVPGAITAIEPVGEREVFDLEVASDNHNFVADGFVVHNCEIKLHVKLPIFVARQWIRHRTANVNEVSGRYSVLPEEFYVPEEKNILPQSKTNKQGRGDTTSPREQRPTEDIQWHMIKANKDSFECYNSVLGAGIARELARVVLPLATYTEWYWKIDLHNLFHFLKLRMDSHAQWEIRQYAEEIFKLVKLWVPVAAQAWLDYQYNSVTLSAAQIKLIAAKLAGEPSEPSTFKLSIREVQELEEALKRDE